VNKNNEIKPRKRAPRRKVEEILETAGPVATFVRMRRKELGYTQEQLARRSGLSTKFIRDLELGKASAKMDSVNKILAFFGHELAPRPIQKEDWI
jgi:y4mF family transcriptional regulator